MGLTYGELKAKYGDCDSTYVQKILQLENGALFEYDDTNLSEYDFESLQRLINNTVNDGAQYGIGVWFPNSSIKFQETQVYNLVETTEYVPNYYFLSDSDGNISDDSKPINIRYPIKKIFPSLRPGYKMEEMVELAESMGANVLSWEGGIVTFNNEWNGGKEESYYNSNIKFELGGYLFKGLGSLQQNVGLDSCFTVSRDY